MYSDANVLPTSPEQEVRDAAVPCCVVGRSYICRRVCSHGASLQLFNSRDLSRKTSCDKDRTDCLKPRPNTERSMYTFNFYSKVNSANEPLHTHILHPVCVTLALRAIGNGGAVMLLASWVWVRLCCFSYVRKGMRHKTHQRLLDGIQYRVWVVEIPRSWLNHGKTVRQ